MPIHHITENISHCICFRCEGDWYSRVKKPKRCRWCGSPLWDQPYKTIRTGISIYGNQFDVHYNLSRAKKRKNKLVAK